MKHKTVGIYRLGDESVQLILREGGGAEFYERSGDIPYMRMEVGADVSNCDLMGAITHEAQELSMVGMRARFQRADSYHLDSTSYVFILTHEQFSDVCARTGMFLAKCLPDVERAWRQWKKGRKVTE